MIKASVKLIKIIVQLLPVVVIGVTIVINLKEADYSTDKLNNLPAEYVDINLEI